MEWPNLSSALEPVTGVFMVTCLAYFIKARLCCAHVGGGWCAVDIQGRRNNTKRTILSTSIYNQSRNTAMPQVPLRATAGLSASSSILTGSNALIVTTASIIRKRRLPKHGSGCHGIE